MSNGIQLTPEALCDGLDRMSIRQLELMDQLIKGKMALEEVMRNGFFRLSKTRYVLGTNAISTLQLPSEDKEVEPLTTVFSTPVNVADYDGDIMYQELDTNFEDPIIAVTEEADEESLNCEAEEDSPIPGLRQRVTHLELTESDYSGEEKDINMCKKKTINRDPIRWFSVLPPQTLKQAQSDFKAALKMSAKCGTIQSELKAVNNEYRRLAKIKAKVDNLEKEP